MFGNLVNCSEEKWRSLMEGSEDEKLDEETLKQGREMKVATLVSPPHKPELRKGKSGITCGH
jgi:hypothetical protein